MPCYPLATFLATFFIIYLRSSPAFPHDWGNILNELALPVHQKRFKVNQEAGRDAVSLPCNLAICPFTPPLLHPICNVIKTKEGYLIDYRVPGNTKQFCEVSCVRVCVHV